jgi:NADH dehydrogenase
METKQNTVLIVGGGFAGISLARKLSKRLPQDAKVVLISNKSYFEYYPALYRVVTGASPIEVCIPLDYMLDKNIELVLDTVINVDLNRKEVTTVKGDVYSAEKIVLALGSETTYFSLPGVATLSLGFKSVKEALTLKNHLYSLFDGHFH